MVRPFLAIGISERAHGGEATLAWAITADNSRLQPLPPRIHDGCLRGLRVATAPRSLPPAFQAERLRKGEWLYQCICPNVAQRHEEETEQTKGLSPDIAHYGVWVLVHSPNADMYATVLGTMAHSYWLTGGVIGVLQIQRSFFRGLSIPRAQRAPRLWKPLVPTPGGARAPARSPAGLTRTSSSPGTPDSATTPRGRRLERHASLQAAPAQSPAGAGSDEFYGRKLAERAARKIQQVRRPLVPPHRLRRAYYR
jgi:hypothetical protein